MQRGFTYHPKSEMKVLCQDIVPISAYNHLRKRNFGNDEHTHRLKALEAEAAKKKPKRKKKQSVTNKDVL